MLGEEGVLGTERFPLLLPCARVLMCGGRGFTPGFRVPFPFRAHRSAGMEVEMEERKRPKGSRTGKRGWKLREEALLPGGLFKDDGARPQAARRRGSPTQWYQFQSRSRPGTGPSG